MPSLGFASNKYSIITVRGLMYNVIKNAIKNSKPKKKSRPTDHKSVTNHQIIKSYRTFDMCLALCRFKTQELNKPMNQELNRRIKAKRRQNRRSGGKWGWGAEI